MSQHEAAGTFDEATKYQIARQRSALDSAGSCLVILALVMEAGMFVLTSVWRVAGADPGLGSSTVGSRLSWTVVICYGVNLLGLLLQLIDMKTNPHRVLASRVTVAFGLAIAVLVPILVAMGMLVLP